MRKLVLQQAAISLDGYICEEGTEFWRSFGPAAQPPAPDDDEYEEHFLAGLRRAGTHIMGRVTYESMAGASFQIRSGVKATTDAASVEVPLGNVGNSG